MFSLLHYSDCPGSPAFISCLTSSLASLYMYCQLTRNGGGGKSCSSTSHGKLVTDSDQSSVSCKFVISSKCIQCILETISKMLHFPLGFAVLNSLISRKIELVTKYKKKQSYYIPRQYLVTFCLIPHKYL